MSNCLYRLICGAWVAVPWGCQHCFNSFHIVDELNVMYMHNGSRYEFLDESAFMHNKRYAYAQTTIPNLVHFVYGYNLACAFKPRWSRTITSVSNCCVNLCILSTMYNRLVLPL